jgi:large subunit ribosomal protein L23
MGAFLGKSRSWKKAIVTLVEGERIEFFEGASV